MKHSKLLLFSTLLTFTGMAWANNTAIPVDDFNLPLTPTEYVTLGAGSAFGTANDWNVTKGSVDVVGTTLGATTWQSPDGGQTLDMDGLTEGQIQTTIDVPVGGTVDVNFWLAGNPEGPPVVKTLDVSLGSLSDSYTFNVTGHDSSDMGWTMETAVFTGQAAGPETLTFTSLDSAPGNLYGPALGTVTASVSPVPDSGSTALLLGMVLAGSALLQVSRLSERMVCQKLSRTQ